MKILHVTKKYPDAIGGDAVVVSNLVSQQKKAGHEVSILTSNCEEITDEPSVYKFGLKSHSASELDAITLKRILSLLMLPFKTLKILRSEHPDIIHTHSVEMGFFVSLAARYYRVPIIHTFHIITFYDQHQPVLRRKTELWFVRNAKPLMITAPNEHDVTQLRQQGLKGVVLLPNGIDLAFWNADPKIEKNQVFTFITVGRLEEQKGGQYLIEAASLLRKANLKFKIVLVGEGSQGISLKALARGIGVEDAVEFAGKKTPQELKRLYASAHTAVLPSLYETTPLTLLEAWATKLPVIITPVGILRGRRKSESALVVKLRDERSLAKAMETVITDKRKVETLALAGYKEVQQFSWDKICKVTDSIYAETTA